MRILHVIHQYVPDHVGGTELYTSNLARVQAQTGHHVAVFCRRDGPGQRLERDMLDDIPIYRATRGSFTPGGRFRATFGDRFLEGALAWAMAETGPDLIHVQHLMGLPVGALAAGDQRIPLVVTLHDYWWVCANAQLITDYNARVCAGPRWWLNCARCGLTRAGAGAAWPLSPLVAPIFAWRATVLLRLIPRVAAWIAPTAFVARWYEAHGLPQARMHVVGHGIDLPSPTVLARSADLARGRGASHFLYVGGLSPQKGLHVLVEAFNEMPEGVRLTIAGDEAAFPEYCAGLRQQATHPGIHFAGRLGREQVWRLMVQADVLVVPSLWYETASLVIQEAFATGTPVVASAHGALNERVRHQVDGLLVPPGDVARLRSTLQSLVDEPGLLERLRAGIRPVMTIVQHADEMDALYHEVLATARPELPGDVPKGNISL